MFASAARRSAAAAPTHYLITLVRSANGLPAATRANLEALGLHRLHERALQAHGPTAAGKILKVKELVEVQNVAYEDGVKALARRRPEGSGVQVVGKY